MTFQLSAINLNLHFQFQLKFAFFISRTHFHFNKAMIDAVEQVQTNYTDHLMLITFLEATFSRHQTAQLWRNLYSSCIYRGQFDWQTYG